MEPFETNQDYKISIIGFIVAVCLFLVVISNKTMDKLQPRTFQLCELKHDSDGDYFTKRRILKIRPDEVNIPDEYKIVKIRYNSYNIRIYVESKKLED